LTKSRASEGDGCPNIVARGLGTGLLDGDGFFHGQLMRSAFPDGYHTFEDVIAEDDKVVTVERLLVHIRRVVWYSADGQAQVTFSVVHVDRVVDGKVVEHWGQGDTMSLMQQLGVLPYHSRVKRSAWKLSVCSSAATHSGQTGTLVGAKVICHRSIRHKTEVQNFTPLSTINQI